MISGSSAGLGRASARALASRNFDLVLGGRSRDRLEQLADELRQAHPGGRFVPSPFDVRHLPEIQAAVAAADSTFGRLDVLVASAGVGMMDFLDRLDPATEIVPQIETNLSGTILLVRTALPRMIAQRSGTIVLMGSLAGLVASPTYSIYAATKFGLIGFADALRRELRAWGIHVVLVLPGAVATGLAAESVARRRTGFKTPRWMLLTPEKVGETVAELAVRPRRIRIIPGWMRPVLWFARAFPWLVDAVTERFFVRKERESEL